MDFLPRQKLISLLNARKSNSKCTAETPNVTKRRTRLVSAKIPFTSSVSLSVNPIPCMEPRAELNCMNKVGVSKDSLHFVCVFVRESHPVHRAEGGVELHEQGWCQQRFPSLRLCLCP